MISNRIVSIAIALLMMSLSNTSIAQPVNLAAFGDMVDLDASIGFSTPRQITILPSYDRTKNIYFVFPNTIEFILATNQRMATGLQVGKFGDRTTAKVGSLTFTILPQFNSADLQGAIQEIKQRNPSAVFTIPVLTASKLQLFTIEKQRDMLADGEGTLLSASNSFTVLLTPVESTVLLLPESYNFPSASFQYSFSLKGVSRVQDGKPMVEIRNITISGVLMGFCAPYPDSTINLISRRRGCSLINLNSKVVRNIQTILKEQGIYSWPIDGQYGPNTDFSIRSYQKKNGLLVTGYPTRELLNQMRE